MAPQMKFHKIQSLNFATLDVFTSTPYEGNPLAVIRIPSSLRSAITQQQKQVIAEEFNLSETVFLHEQRDPNIAEWDIDIFTTNDELPFAGHPTIGAAYYALSGCMKNSFKSGVFITKAGRIPIEMIDRTVRVMVPHNIHIHAHRIEDLLLPMPGLSADIGLIEAEMKAPIVTIVKGMTFLLVRLSSLKELATVQLSSPDLSFHGMLDAEEGWREGFVARYYYVVLDNGRRSEDGHADGAPMQIRTRMLEVDMEDPATGSAASALGSYLALQEGRSMSFEIEQGVEMGRKCTIGVEVGLANGVIHSVRLSGTAVQVMEGSLRI